MRGLIAINTTRFGRTSRALLLAVAVAVAAGVLALVETKPAEAAFPGENGKIAFASARITGPGVDNPEGDLECVSKPGLCRVAGVGHSIKSAPESQESLLSELV